MIFDTAAADVTVCFLINRADTEKSIVECFRFCRLHQDTGETTNTVQTMHQGKILYHGPCEGVWVTQQGTPVWISL